jgi:hypothetical protein
MKQEMITKVAQTVAALALAVTVATGTAVPASASITGVAMGCAEGQETVIFTFPQEGPGRVTIFAYSLNGGAWQWTPWYYTWNGFTWIWNGTAWEGLPGGIASFKIVGNLVNVSGYGFQQNPDGTWERTQFPDCQTSTYLRSDGYIYTYNN